MCRRKGLRQRPAAVERAHLFGQLLGDRGALSDQHFGNLVADAPDHDGGMVAVPQHHCRNVPLPPFVKIAAIVELDLVGFPGIERLRPAPADRAGRTHPEMPATAGCAHVRTALNPAAFSNSTRRSSARSNAAAPSGPLSWCTHPPASLIALPFSNSPFSGDHASVRMPKVVTTSSTTLPSLRRRVTARYSAGASGDHKAGLTRRFPGWIRTHSPAPLRRPIVHGRPVSRHGPEFASPPSPGLARPTRFRLACERIANRPRWRLRVVETSTPQCAT